MGAAIPYEKDHAVSADGTKIGYRKLGRGPGLVLVHGGMQASQGMMRLASHLSDSFTLYIPDRRGRGMSGPFRPGHGIEAEVADVRAVVEKTGAELIFGHSSGAIIALEVAALVPSIKASALYEPSYSVTAPAELEFYPRLEREVKAGELAQAVTTFIKGIKVSRATDLMPRFILSRLIGLGIKKGDACTGDDVPFRTLIPTVLVDVGLTRETAGTLQKFKGLRSAVLLQGGSKGPQFLKDALKGLAETLPNAEQVVFAGLDHGGPDYGDPARVANGLKAFFQKARPAV